MEPPYAYTECCLKIHSDWGACKTKIAEVLRSIVGVYSINWEAEGNNFKVTGQVDPTILLKAIMRTDNKHAEMVSVKMNHPSLPPSRRPRYYNYGGGSTSRTHLPPAYRDGYRSSMLNIPYYETNNDRYYPNGVPPQIGYTSCDYNTTYDYQNPPLTRANYVPSYSYQEYHDPYSNYEGMNVCTIM